MQSDDLDVQAALVELGQDLDHVGRGGRALDEDRAAARPRLEIAHHVRAARGLEVRRHAQRLAVGQLDRRPRQVQCNERHVRRQGRAENDRHLVVFPRMEIDHVPFREELRHGGLEDAEVRA